MILDCSFRGNRATLLGGVISFEGKKLYITSSLFESNCSVNRYASHRSSSGRAIYAKIGSYLKIYNGSFHRNKATLFGGAICTEGKELLLKSSDFKDNAVGIKHVVEINREAVITIYKSGKIVDSLLSMSGAVGILSDSTIAQILNFSFARNKAMYGGGAIYTVGKKIAIKFSLFENNTVEGKYTFGPFGGALCTMNDHSFVDILNCSFKWNKALYAGGAIYTVGKEISIKFSLFEYDTVEGKYTVGPFGGALCTTNDHSFIDILNCSFKRNKAVSGGGAIYTTGMKIVIKSSLFEYNTVEGKYTVGPHGGAICAANTYSFADILNYLFKRNKATQNGGAFHMAGKYIVIKSSVFEHNAAVGNHTTKRVGGAISTYLNDNSVLSILNCSFEGNKAMHAGGAIYTNGNKLFIELSLFKYNTVCENYTVCGEFEGLGVALFVQNTTKHAGLSPFNKSLVEHSFDATDFNSLHIFNCSFRANVAKRNGGAIYSVDNKSKQ